MPQEPTSRTNGRDDGCQNPATAYTGSGIRKNFPAMFTSDKPEFVIAVLALAALAGFAVWRLALWIKSAPVTSDPWDEETERAVQEDDAIPVCHHCLTPAKPGQWFCEHCGCAVGPYNNLMPYVDVFSQGEALRNGTMDRMPLNFLTATGYLLISLFTFPFIAPVFW